MVEERIRLDAALVQRGLAPSGSRAQAMIMAGEAWVDGVRVDKPGKKISAQSSIEIRSAGPRFASRGGEKLLGALEQTGIDVAGMTALDVGASTGGFTDVLLQRGAGKVYAVDVGKGLLDWRLRNDERVIVIEAFNARYISGQEVPEPVDIAVFDASFISLELLIPPALALVRDDGVLLPMIKPQFEVGRQRVPRGGVVRDPALHADVLQRMVSFLYTLGVSVVDLAASPLPGPKGNREFFIHAVKRLPAMAPDCTDIIERIVHERP